MSALQGVVFITFDINTKETEFIRNDNITDYDTNATNIYVQSKYKKSDGETVYLSSSEIANYNFSLYTMKPLTNNVSEITGEVTNELIEQVRGGVIKFVIPKACTNRSGIVKCELHINKEKEKIASTRFILDVQQSLVTKFNDSLLDDEDFPVLKQLILEIQKDSNIDDNNRSKITSYSSDKVENIKEDLSSQIKDIASKKANKNDMNLFGINKRFLQDAYGFYSINFFGDSITQGYNSSNHYEKSYMSLLRKSFQKEYSTTNVGFVNVHPTGYYQTLTTSGEWTNTQSYNYLGSQVIQSTEINATITIIPKFPQKYFSICYEQNTTNGAFDIYVNDTLKLTVNSAGDLNYCKKTETIELNGFDNIKIVKKDNNKVAISGLWYYDDATKVMINNYSRAGNTLSDMPSHILDIACDCNILFMALNHNDSDSMIDNYRANINYIRDKVKSNKVFTMFLDFKWTIKTSVIKDEIKRVYNELQSEKYPCMYLDVGAEMWQNELYYMQKYGFLLNGDNSHPTDLGHRIIAQTLCKILCIQFQEEYSINKQYSSDTDWIIIEDLLNGWTNTYEQYPSRYKLSNGFLCIEYYLVYGTLGQPAFKLPVGFRPRTQCRVVTNIYKEDGATNYSRCEIGMDGNVTITASKDGNQYGNIVIAL